MTRRIAHVFVIAGLMFSGAVQAQAPAPPPPYGAPISLEDAKKAALAVKSATTPDEASFWQWMAVKFGI